MDIPRTATIRSMNYSIYAELTRTSFQELCEDFPFMYRKIKTFIENYNDPLKNFVLKMIRNCDPFKEISDSTANDIYYAMEMIYLQHDQKLVFKKEDGTYENSIFFLIDGKLEYSV